MHVRHPALLAHARHLFLAPALEQVVLARVLGLRRQRRRLVGAALRTQVVRRRHRRDVHHAPDAAVGSAPQQCAEVAQQQRVAAHVAPQRRAHAQDERAQPVWQPGFLARLAAKQQVDARLGGEVQPLIGKLPTPAPAIGMGALIAVPGAQLLQRHWSLWLNARAHKPLVALHTNLLKVGECQPAAAADPEHAIY